jgi:hypothetical protein
MIGRKETTKLKRVFSLRLEDPVFDKIETISKKQHRSMTNMIEFILIDYLRKYGVENGEIETNYED